MTIFEELKVREIARSLMLGQIAKVEHHLGSFSRLESVNLARTIICLDDFDRCITRIDSFLDFLLSFDQIVQEQEKRGHHEPSGLRPNEARSFERCLFRW